jgi:iron complex outermembrane receptor protein
MSKSRYLASSILASALVTGLGAAAQSVPPQSAVPPVQPNHAAAAPEEVVVTATKVRSKERKTPISMEVLSAATIAQKGITDVASLATQDSSVNFVSGGGEGVVGIRGIATQNTTEIGSPSVPISTDGFFMSRPYTFNDSLYDVARIEVLRGPQGTLYGRNATGGVINVIDSDPTKFLTGYEEVTVGDYGTINSTGAISGPITDTLQVRAAYTTLNHDGYRDNGSVGHGDDQDSKSGRIKFAWEPAENFKANLTLQYTNVAGTGPTDEVVPYLGAPAGVPTYTGNGSGFPLSSQDKLDIDEKAVRLNLAWSELPGDTTLTYLGGYDVLDWHRLSAQSFVTDTSQSIFNQNESPHTQNHELRLASNTNQRLTWQVGAFYFEEDNRLDTSLQDEVGTSKQFDFLYFHYKVRTQSTALFGQATYKITDQLNLTGGLRYTEDALTRYENFALPGFGLFFPETVEKGNYSKLTWHVGLDYNPTSDLLVYAKADKGYKSGGFNGVGKQPFASEVVYAYEAGAKDRLFGGLAQVNADGFYEEYVNQQLTAFVPLTQSGATAVYNAGSRIYGFDLGGTARVDPVGKFDLSLTYLHARFDNSTVLPEATLLAPTYTVGSAALVNIGGEQLPQAPDLSLTAGFEHAEPLYNGTITGRIETKYVSSEYLHIFNDPYSHVPAYTMSNVYLRYDFGNGRYLVELFVKNLENSNVLSDAAENIGGPEQFYNFGFDPPRTYGARMRVNF